MPRVCIECDSDILEACRERAKKEGVSPAHVMREMLRAWRAKEMQA